MTYTEESALIDIETTDGSIVNICSADFYPMNDLAKQLENKYSIMEIVKHDISFGALETRVYSIAKDKVLCLIMSAHSYDLYHYSHLHIGLTFLKEHCQKNNVKVLIMPMLGCDKNVLEYKEVKNIIKEMFNDMDISIIVRDPRFKIAEDA